MERRALFVEAALTVFAEKSDAASSITDSPGWTMFGYTTEPGSLTEEHIRLLGSLAATDVQQGEKSHRLTD